MINYLTFSIVTLWQTTIYTPITQDQFQKYILILKEQITESFPLSIEELL